VKYKILNISPRFGEAGKDQIKKIEDVTRIILENRGLKTKKEIEEFLNPRLEKVTAESVGIDSKQFFLYFLFRVKLRFLRFNDFYLFYSS